MEMMKKDFPALNTKTNFITRFKLTPESHTWYRYLFSIIVSFTALYLQGILEPYILTVHFLLLYPAIFLIAWLAGTGPTFLAGVICTLGADYYFFDPPLSFEVHHTGEALRLLLFFTLSVMVGFVTGRSHMKLRKRTKEASDIRHALNSSSVVAVTDEEGRIITVNSKFCELSQYSLEELEGKNSNILNSGHHPKSFFADMWKTIKKGNVWTGDIKNKAKDGSYFWVSTFIVPFLNESGTPYQYIAINTDITEKKAAEEKLSASESRFKLLVEGTKDYGLFMLDPLGNVASWNKGAERINGYKSEEVIGRHFSLFYTKEDKEKNHPENELKIATKTGSYHEQGWRVKKNGEKFWAEITINTIMNEENHIIGFAKITRDMTESRKAEIALRESERDFRSFFELSGSGAEVIDAYNYKFLKVNPMLCRLLGYSEEELKQKTFLEVTFDDDRGREVNAYEETKKGVHDHWELEKRYVRKDGAIIWAQVNGTMVRNEEGQAVHSLAIIQDITERKEIEKKIEENVMKLKESEITLKNTLAARDEFLTIASHELKTPLTSLKISTQLQKRGRTKERQAVYSPENINSYIDLVDRQVERMAALVEDMLNVTRIKAGRFEIHRANFDLTDLVEEVIEKLAPRFVLAGYDLPLVEQNGDLKGNWDRDKLEQVLTGLLMNAILYGEKRPIRINLKGGKESIRLQVVDQGIGVKEAMKERIFNPYERGVDKNEVSGLGLGLFISRQIIEAHGGKIWVESGDKRGSTFSVELPKDKSAWTGKEVVQIL